MIDAISKAAFGTLAASATLKRLASRYGMRGDRGFARRFVAGEHIDEAIAAARSVEAQGLSQTRDLLGESVASEAEASAATAACLDMIPRIAGAGIGCNISIKLTQLGLDLSPAIATHDPARDSASVSTFRTVANGSHTSCAGWANAPRTSASC